MSHCWRLCFIMWTLSVLALSVCMEQRHHTYLWRVPSVFWREAWGRLCSRVIDVTNVYCIWLLSLAAKLLVAVGRHCLCLKPSVKVVSTPLPFLSVLPVNWLVIISYFRHFLCLMATLALPKTSQLPEMGCSRGFCPRLSLSSRFDECWMS